MTQHQAGEFLSMIQPEPDRTKPRASRLAIPPYIGIYLRTRDAMVTRDLASFQDVSEGCQRAIVTGERDCA